MENQRDSELVQRYFDRSLTETEMHELEYRLKEELGLRSLFNEQKLLVAGIRYGHLREKLEKLRSLEASQPYKTSGKRNPRIFQLYWKPLAIAASILLIATLWIVSTRSSTPLNERLYAQYYEPFDSPGTGLTRGVEDELTPKARAYVAYDAGNYVEAAQLFEEAISGNDNAIMHLCLGNAYLKLGQTKKAEKVFQHILTEHVDLVTQAKWYLALTYLSEGNLERTRANLWEISKSSTYGEKARKLLKELD